MRFVLQMSMCCYYDCKGVISKSEELQQRQCLKNKAINTEVCRMANILFRASRDFKMTA